MNLHQLAVENLSGSAFRGWMVALCALLCPVATRMATGQIVDAQGEVVAHGGQH